MGESVTDAAVRRAVQTVARSMVHVELLAAAQRTLDWGDYPEIGEHDWERVVDEVIKIAELMDPGKVEYQAAYELLTTRAESDA